MIIGTGVASSHIFSFLWLYVSDYFCITDPMGLLFWLEILCSNDCGSYFSKNSQQIYIINAKFYQDLCGLTLYSPTSGLSFHIYLAPLKGKFVTPLGQNAGITGHWPVYCISQFVDNLLYLDYHVIWGFLYYRHRKHWTYSSYIATFLLKGENYW